MQRRIPDRYVRCNGRGESKPLLLPYFHSMKIASGAYTVPEVNDMLAFLYWLFRDALFFFGIVAGRGSFPRPLSREEERQAILQMQAGDEDARRRLIEHNLRLVSHIARKYTVPGFTSEDLVSVGSLGLVKAVNTFRPETGAQLSSYAARCIENAMPSPMRHGQKTAVFLPIFGTFAPGFPTKCISCVAQREVR